MTLQREEDYQLSIPEYARKFVEEINRKRNAKGDSPLAEDALHKLLDKLADIHSNY